MARPLRFLEPDGIYHVTTVGVNRAAVFLTTDDRLRFLTLLERIVRRLGWLCQEYCLLTNHFHLVVQTPEPNLSRGMHWLNGVYAQSFNRKHERTGHLFGDRFYAVQVRTDGHLLEVTRYVARNPIRAGLCRQPYEWEWSSYGSLIGYRAPLAFVDYEGVLRRFGRSRGAAIRAIRAFVEKE
jgi:putative transposase